MNQSDLSNQKLPSPKTAFRASWVCPVNCAPIENGIVVVEDRMIQFVGKFNEFAGDCEIQDLGDGAIIPGLINAHTHLEFSDLESPLGHPEIKFTDWIRLIVKSRMDSNEEPANKKHLAIQSGLKQSTDAGVVAVGEIATSPFRIEDYQSEGIAALIVLEQLGSDDSALEARHEELAKFLELQNELQNHPGQFSFGASAHAPYSCTEKLVDQICTQAASQNRIVAMHVAETIAEKELLAIQHGDFVELLKDFGVWDPANFPSRTRHVYSTLAQLSKSKSLVIHGNYLDDLELDLIAQHRDMTIVFCPRTHKYFGHPTYPLEQMRSRSIRVAVGTDSRASNPDLDLFAELKLIADSFPELDSNEVLKMGTSNGAEALGLNSFGSLDVGNSGAINFVAQPDGYSRRTIGEWIFSSETHCQPIIQVQQS